MYNTNAGQVLGASALGSASLSLLGVPVETSVMLGLGVLGLLLVCYLIYKFRNRNLR